MAAARLAEGWARATGTRCPLTRYAVEHLSHDFVLDTSRAERDLGYRPDADASSGALR